MYETHVENIVSIFIPFYDEIKSVILLMLIMSRARVSFPCVCSLDVRQLTQYYVSTGCRADISSRHPAIDQAIRSPHRPHLGGHLKRWRFPSAGDLSPILSTHLLVEGSQVKVREREGQAHISSRL